jgi:hypothetical protein
MTFKKNHPWSLYFKGDFLDKIKYIVYTIKVNALKMKSNYMSYASELGMVEANDK